jgi:pilus assembly protein CpaC
MNRLPPWAVAQVEKQPKPEPKAEPKPEARREEAPPPRPVEPFPRERTRLPRLGDRPGPLGTTPRPTEKELAEYRRFVQEFVDPRNTLDLVMGRTRLMILKRAPTRTQIAEERIATYNLIRATEISLLGREIGSTVLNMWFPDPDNPNKEIILSYLVRVIPDPEAKERLERVYKALADEINHAFPDSHVCLFLVGDKLAVSGQAKDIAEATQILRIVRSNAPQEPQPSHIPVNNVNLVVRPGDLNAPGGLPGLESFLLAGGPNVINLLRVPGEQQVMLRVTVAEVNRAAARSIGLNFAIFNKNGVQVFAQNTGNILQGGNTGFGAANNVFGGIGGIGNAGIGNGAFGGGLNIGDIGGSNLMAVLDAGKVPIAIDALRNLDYARSLAEPNLTTLNGQTATFLAGGEFPVPVVTGFTAAGLQGVSFIPYGVQLTFTPFVTDRDRIRLTMAAEVSVRDVATGAAIGGAAISGLAVRDFQTTVELREGQTLAVAGLIQNNLGADGTRVPFFGDLPIIGRLFALDRISHADQELVVLVTPELVHPMEPKEVPPLPGADIFEPGDVEFYLLGRLESRRDYDYRSPARTDIHRMLKYHQCEDVYIQGPHGHAEPPSPP